MIRKNTKLDLLAFLSIFVLLVVFVAVPAKANAKSAVNIDKKGVAIKGYDPVAYFTMSKPMKGKKDFEASWMGASWLFASAGNRVMFQGEPEKYAPRYGGYCAYGVATNSLFDINPKAWTVYKGHLYLNKSLNVRDMWSKDIPGNIRKADANWPGLSGMDKMMDDSSKMMDDKPMMQESDSMMVDTRQMMDNPGTMGDDGGKMMQ